MGMTSARCKQDEHDGCKGVVKYRKKAEADIDPQPIHQADCACDCHAETAGTEAEPLTLDPVEIKQRLDKVKAESRTVTPESSEPSEPSKPKRKGLVAHTERLELAKDLPKGHPDRLYYRNDAVQVAGIPGVLVIHHFTKNIPTGAITVTGWDMGKNKLRTFDADKIKRHASLNETPENAYQQALKNLERIDKKKKVRH